MALNGSRVSLNQVPSLFLLQDLPLFRLLLHPVKIRQHALGARLGRRKKRWASSQSDHQSTKILHYKVCDLLHFFQFLNCHISTTRREKGIILGTVQGLPFNENKPKLEVCSIGAMSLPGNITICAASLGGSFGLSQVDSRAF